MVIAIVQSCQMSQLAAILPSSVAFILTFFP